MRVDRSRSVDHPEPAEPEPSPDDRLVERCLRNDNAAWTLLVARYDRLVYAVIRRSGAARGEENDLFQAVWIDVYRELSNLRRRQSLRHWIATITRHKCYHWGRRSERRPMRPWDAKRAALLLDPSPPADLVLEQIDREQEVREAIDSLSPRCRELLRLLFLSDPPTPYAEVAARFGLAVGSIGFLRGTCLERLKEALIARGLP